jgi:Holliday junction resolvase RusA-like endonuclease
MAAMASIMDHMVSPPDLPYQHNLVVNSIRKSIMFSVDGDPKPQQRPMFIPNRSGDANKRFRVISPSKVKTCDFTKKVREQLTGVPRPYFGEEEKLAVFVTYRMKRANTHFEKSKRATGKVKTAYETKMPGGGDIDNLLKQTLDCLTDIVYHDDRMVSTVVVTKIWCEDHNSEGSTTVAIKSTTH